MKKKWKDRTRLNKDLSALGSAGQTLATPCVMCHVSHVTCHLSPVTSQKIFFLMLFLKNYPSKQIGQSGGASGAGGSVINGAYPVYFILLFALNNQN